MADDTVQGGYVFGARKMVGKVQADKATTQSVVYSIIMLFAANYILSSILF